MDTGRERDKILLESGTNEIEVMKFKLRESSTALMWPRFRKSL